MTILSAVALTASLTIPAQAQPSKTWLRISESAFIAGEVLDMHSTRRALQSPYLRESNPMLPERNFKGIVTLSTLYSAAALWLGEKLFPRHPKLIVATEFIAAAFEVRFAVKNYRLYRRYTNKVEPVSCLIK